MSSATIIRNGRVIDPGNKRDEIADLLIVDGKIAPVSQLSTLNTQPDEIDARNLIVCPGLIDMHVHLREPGFGHKETIESGARAAAAGGFTTVVCMPNTSPVADNPSTIAWIKDRAAAVACANVLPAGAISKNLAGEELAPIGSLAQAGVVAITDDGHCVQNHEVMRRALEYARMVDVPVLDHCQYFARGTLRSSHSLPASEYSRKCPIAARSTGARCENQRRSLPASHRVDRRSDPKF
jgi:dihydroorotase